MFASLNLLNNDECETLLRSQDASEDSNNQPWNKEREICVGKKHKFPKPVLMFSRIKKTRNKRQEEMQRAKESMCHKLQISKDFIFFLLKLKWGLLLASDQHYLSTDLGTSS